ncbi:glutaredoxin family protein [Granulosicoccus antarcticus]|uniref:Thioredoxin-like fold domain-containing protein n=1 Tax=Granulosicoccus antarcticus IMCC3135 TaxID=1192854 RepID=A0A2Z2NXG9_9GAMM|nr:glutaredoxin family protein [Granulosicoccus antarcticus]ASJ74458.1 hypothetical protein IMCC3135_21930 [Granulosicoccus antarcticus IMCC3135]
MLPELILYFREGCHLCEDMEQLLGELLEPDTFHLTRVDIDEDPVLRERYNVRVPVLSLVRLSQNRGSETGAHLEPIAVRSIADLPSDDEQIVLSEHFLDLEAVREALASYNRKLLAACTSPAE